MVGMSPLTIRAVMTESPVTIAADQPIADAHRMMREHAIRHLPVLAGRKLVGLVSMRDLHFIETLKDIDPGSVAVSEAMTPEPYAISPRAHLDAVAREMMQRKIGSAVVVDRGKVVGVFTTVDALRVLAGMLEEEAEA
jgi:acetoin utilization protein AcuB